MFTSRHIVVFNGYVQFQVMPLKQSMWDVEATVINFVHKPVGSDSNFYGSSNKQFHYLEYWWECCNVFLSCVM